MSQNILFLNVFASMLFIVCFYFYGGVVISKRGKDAKKTNAHIINENIKADKVLVIGPNGEQVGERKLNDALTLAEAAGLDLVLMAANSNPPVTRIMDYGKFRYDQQRKQRENRKNQKTVQLKEVRLTPVTDIHDIQTKAKNTRKFIEKGHKVKVSVFFRGRQMEHKELGNKVLEKFYEYVEDVAEIERDAKMEGRYMSMFIMPKK